MSKRSGKFEYWQCWRKSEPETWVEWRFRLRAANGKIICQSEGYTSKAGCLNGIKAVQSVAADAPVVEV